MKHPEKSLKEIEKMLEEQNGENADKIRESFLGHGGAREA